MHLFAYAERAKLVISEGAWWEVSSGLSCFTFFVNFIYLYVCVCVCVWYWSLNSGT
jgi:hypothetical protein